MTQKPGVVLPCLLTSLEAAGAKPSMQPKRKQPAGAAELRFTRSTAGHQ